MSTRDVPHVAVQFYALVHLSLQSQKDQKISLSVMQAMQRQSPIVTRE